MFEETSHQFKFLFTFFQTNPKVCIFIYSFWFLLQPILQKRWSSPRIIDRVLEYIPELENEIENLTLKKDNMLSSLENEQTHQNQPSDLQVPTVSVTEVRKDEVIVQICMQREPGNVLSNLMQNVEGEGMGIMSASSLYVCDERICYHLHIQVCILHNSM